MAVEIVQLTAADWEEGMAFLNEVFGEHRPHDFATLLPSIYQPTDGFMAHNHAVRVDGAIRAVVGLFPMTWKVGDIDLKVGGIGGVSTHKSVRGAGYMQQLMTHCVELMQADDYHLSWLGGQRQRYGYFGYEKCGCAPSVSLSPTNLRHAGLADPGLRFTSLDADDAQRLAAARDLHDSRRVHVRRDPASFHRFLVSWYHQPWVALDEAGEVVGYLVADAEGGSVLELVARDAATATTVAAGWVHRRGEGVRIALDAADFDLTRRLGILGEGAGVSASGNWQIFDWAATVEALMRVQAAGGVGLADGRVRLGIEGYGTLQITVRDGEPACERLGADAADAAWHPFTAMRVLFGPQPAGQVTDVPAALAPLLAWAPLPLDWPRQDGV